MREFDARYNPGRPDWVMCGIPWEDGKVAILASTELSYAELQAQADVVDDFWRERPIMAYRRYTLSVEMSSFVIVVGATYQDAFRSLFERWTPRQQRHQLAENRPQITDG